MRDRLRGQDGFTLIELLWGLVLSIIVIGAVLTFMIFSLKQQNVSSSRSVAARQAEGVLARLTRELREAQYIPNTSTGTDTTPVNVTYGSGTSSVSFYVPNAGSVSAGTLVTWTCTAGGSCTRSAGGSTVTELSGISSATFTPLGAGGTVLASNAGTGSSPSYPSSVDIQLQVKDISQADRSGTTSVSGISNPITVEDGVALRNYSP